jgi:predicted tellurium resistance membrane protein TerC
VLAYNMVHGLAFVVLGQMVSWLVTEAERHVALRYAVLVLLIFIAVHVYGALFLFARPLLAGPTWWQLGAASLLAAGLMAWYLLWRHPELRRSLREIPLGAEGDELEAAVKTR